MVRPEGWWGQCSQARFTSWAKVSLQMQLLPHTKHRTGGTEVKETRDEGETLF